MPQWPYHIASKEPFTHRISSFQRDFAHGAAFAWFGHPKLGELHGTTSGTLLAMPSPLLTTLRHPKPTPSVGHMLIAILTGLYQ